MCILIDRLFDFNLIMIDLASPIDSGGKFSAPQLRYPGHCTWSLNSYWKCLALYVFDGLSSLLKAFHRISTGSTASRPASCLTTSHVSKLAICGLLRTCPRLRGRPPRPLPRAGWISGCAGPAYRAAPPALRAWWTPSSPRS